LGFDIHPPHPLDQLLGGTGTPSPRLGTVGGQQCPAGNEVATMHRIWGIVVGLVGWLALAGAARAGIYNPRAKILPRPQSLEQVRLILSELRGIYLPAPPGARPNDGSLRDEYERQAARLEAKGLEQWDLDDRLSLSACYIRMKKYDKAVGVLR